MLITIKIKKKWLALIVSIVILSACTTVPKRDANVLNYDKSNTDYYTLVSKVKSQQALPEDYDMLIRIFPLSSLYDPTSDNEQKSKLLSQSYMENQQWQSCLDTNNALLKVNYTSLTGHYGAAVCAAELGNIVLGSYHNSILDNFIEAIWRTGSGKSPETPFYVTSVDDLYAFIQLHQLVAVGQSLTYVNKLPIQAIKVQNQRIIEPILGISMLPHNLGEALLMN